MSRFGCLLFILVACDGVLSSEEQNGFVQELDFSPIFDAGRADNSGLASDPVAAAILKADSSLLPQLYDTASSDTLDAIHKRSAPSNNVFSSEHFGFNPIASQGFRPPVQSAKLKAPSRIQQNPRSLPLRQQANQLYDIRTVHDADYKVYKPEEEQGEILAALKKNPTVSNYFQPGLTNVEVAQPVKYRREEAVENLDSDFTPNHYLSGSSRIRRYAGAGGRRPDKKRQSEEQDDEPYDYRADYVSRPKEFDGGHYSSAYKEEKDPNKDYEYPYGYDSGYDHKEYDRIKDLSEKQAAEIKQNPGNCKESKKDGMTCMVCKDPKTGGNYESCSYVQEPKNNKYAYSKEKKFDSKDEPDEPEGKNEGPKRSEKYQETPNKENKSEEYVQESAPEKRHAGNYRKADDEDDSDDNEKYNAYYTHRSKPTPSEALRAAEESESSEESDSVVKPYNYKKEIPELYTDNEPKKDVEHVLAEFKKKDRSSCKKVNKNGMTCFQCIDKNGLKNEECMYVSESAPKQSHLAYQEVKEFTSKPATLDGAESQQITTNAPQPQRSAAYVIANGGYGKKLKRKKTPQVAQAFSATNVNPTVAAYIRKVKRSVDEEEEAEERAAIVDQSNVAPPEEFAGDNSKGAYWSETMPRYSAALGVTLPEYMLARSEHEASFDEVVSGA